MADNKVIFAVVVGIFALIFIIAMIVFIVEKAKFKPGIEDKPRVFEIPPYHH